LQPDNRLWLILLPFWGKFAGLLNSSTDIVDHSMKAMGILIVPYVLMALNTVTDSIFYGLGKTQYQAYQSIITNGTAYVVAFILFLTGIWEPDFTSILILFGIGIVIDSILTFWYARRVLFRNHPVTL
jgi:Na+-driven multidrug efflux pump